MKRRSFLRMLGLAPVMAAMPAVAARDTSANGVFRVSVPVSTPGAENAVTMAVSDSLLMVSPDGRFSLTAHLPGEVAESADDVRRKYVEAIEAATLPSLKASV